MKKLARKWRRTRRDEDDDKFVLPTSEDVDSRPIDTQGLFCFSHPLEFLADL